MMYVVVFIAGGMCGAVLAVLTLALCAVAAR